VYVQDQFIKYVLSQQDVSKGNELAGAEAIVTKLACFMIGELKHGILCATVDGGEQTAGDQIDMF
jgi:hypothetical protein